MKLLLVSEPAALELAEAVRWLKNAGRGGAHGYSTLSPTPSTSSNAIRKLAPREGAIPPPVS